MRRNQDLDTLALRGYRADAVERVRKFCVNHQPHISLLFLWQQFIEKLSRYPTGEGPIRAFRLTVCADDKFEGSRASERSEYETEFVETIHHLPLDLKKPSDADIQACERLALGVAAGKFQQQPNPAQAEMRKRIHRSISLACFDQCFMITTNGYMGFCPSYAKVGDRICILFGGRRPYIIRQEPDVLRFIGQCYVHGLMDGEAMGIARRHHWPTEPFDLE